MKFQFALGVLTVAILTSCGGGGNGTQPSATPPTATPAPSPTPSPTPTTMPATESQANEPISASGETFVFSTLANGSGGSLSLPPSNGPGATPTGTITATLSETPPAGVPEVANALGYVSLVTTAAIDLTSTITATFMAPSGVSCGSPALNIAYYPGSGSWYTPAVPNPFSGYNFACGTTTGPASITMQINSSGLDFSSNTTYAIAFY